MCKSPCFSGQSGRRALLSALSVVFVSTLAPQAQAVGVSTGFSGNAYGTAITVSGSGGSITPGSTAVVAMCSLTPGVLYTNSIPSVLVSNLADVETITTGIVSANYGGNTYTTAAVSVASVNLLGGLIKGTGLAAVSTANFNGSSYTANTAGTTFGTLKVLGIPVSVNVAPNTSITLPGIGSVVLNEQTVQETAGYSAVYVNLIHVTVTAANSLGIPIGTSVVVGSANAAVLPATSFLSGGAYEASINAVGLNLAPATSITMPCGGTFDVLQQNTAASLNLPNIVILGALTSGQYGSVTTTGAYGETASEITNVNLLSGLVNATALLAVANVAVNSTTTSVSDTGSVFTGLSVTGHPEIIANPPANTEVQIANLGTLYLHRVIQTPTSIEVRMVELVVTLENTLGLPVGADIILGDANLTAIVPE